MLICCFEGNMLGRWWVTSYDVERCYYYRVLDLVSVLNTYYPPPLNFKNKSKRILCNLSLKTETLQIWITTKIISTEFLWYQKQNHDCETAKLPVRSHLGLCANEIWRKFLRGWCFVWIFELRSTGESMADHAHFNLYLLIVKQNLMDD